MKDRTQTIECPRCRHTFALEVALSDRLRGSIEAKLRTIYDAQLAAERKTLLAELTRTAKAEAERTHAEHVGRLEALAAERETALRRAHAQLEVAGSEAALRARSEVMAQLSAKDHEIKRQQDAILSLRQHEIKMRAEKAKLEERQHALELENARTLDAERTRLRGEQVHVLEIERTRMRQELASVQAETVRTRDLEHAQQTEALRRQVEDLRRRLEAGGEQLRGEAREVRLEEVLRAAFPGDSIEAIGRGVHGADVRQRVCPPGAKPCGVILYENKHTAAWSPRWTAKMRDDQRAEQADIAVLVTAALPKGVTTFALVDGVWVTGFACLPSLTLALRLGLLQLAAHKQATIGRGEKKELMYAYLTGEVFRRHIEFMVSTYTDMGDDLVKERRALMSAWRRREKQLERMTASLGNLYADLQTIAGVNTLPKLAPFELTGLPAGDGHSTANEGSQQAMLM